MADPVLAPRRDVRLLFTARILRMVAYGGLSIVLALYLAALGFDGLRIGIVLAATLGGDAAVSLILTTRADRFGRRRTLVVGGALMVLAGVVLAASGEFIVVVIVATIGVLSPSGNEVGPFLAVEQAALAQAVGDERRTTVFGWYALAGSLATAGGALAAGLVAGALMGRGAAPVDAYRAVVVGYALMGLAILGVVALLTPAIEAPLTERRARLGLHRSRGRVARLAALFSLDAFGGGFVMQSLVAYWFHTRFGVDPAMLGGILFVANVLAAFSAPIAAWLSRRIGLIETMVFTHLPSNVLLALVPLMPTLAMAGIVYLLRMSISQMDVPTRQSYTMAVVEPDERSAAAGITGIARTLGAGVSPLIAGPLVAGATLAGAPFVIAGTLKIAYDLLVYRAFRSVRPPEERAEDRAEGQRDAPADAGPTTTDASV